MGRWHCLPPRPRRLCRRRRPQLPGRHPISPLTIHAPEPGDYGDGDPRTAGADDTPDFPCVDCTEYGECVDHENDPGCYEEAEYGPHDTGCPPGCTSPYCDCPGTA